LITFIVILGTEITLTFLKIVGLLRWKSCMLLPSGQAVEILTNSGADKPTA
jgi:hypothetical protein